MKIQTLSLHPYENPLITGAVRSGVLLHLTDEHNFSGWGDIAPLPKWSLETLADSITQINQEQEKIKKIEWTKETCLQELIALNLLPSLSFGLESALLSILDPTSDLKIQTSALFMGTPQEILKQADLRKNEGYISAKLKVGHLSFEEALPLIQQLKDSFHLRIDVNCAWETKDALRFFSNFPLDTFDYIEEPFQNPHDLALFPHPLAVDESFPKNLSLSQLESFPTLKALIYKPTIQGGIAQCITLHEWAKRKKIDLILSSSFESAVGLSHIANMARRLSLSSPIGTGTCHFFTNQGAIPL